MTDGAGDVIHVELAPGLRCRVAPGAGERVLWCHGYAMDAGVWEPLWTRLPGWYHIGVDLPGHGLSAPPDGETLPELAGRLGRVAVDNSIRHIVGLSFGTMVSLQLVVDHPTAFDSLLLAAPALAGQPSDSDMEHVFERLIVGHRMGAPAEEVADEWLGAPVFDGVRGHDELRRDLKTRAVRHRWDGLADGSLRSLAEGRQSLDDLRRIRSNVTVVVGSDELPAFRAAATTIVRAVPGADEQVLDGLGHLCLLESPDRAAPLIEEHLRRAADGATANR